MTQRAGGREPVFGDHVDLGCEKLLPRVGVLVAFASVGRRFTFVRGDRSVGEHEVRLLSEGDERVDQLDVAELEERSVDVGVLVLRGLELGEQRQPQVARKKRADILVQRADGLVSRIGDFRLELLERQVIVGEVPGHELRHDEATVEERLECGRRRDAKQRGVAPVAGKIVSCLERTVFVPHDGDDAV